MSIMTRTCTKCTRPYDYDGASYLDCPHCPYCPEPAALWFRVLSVFTLIVGALACVAVAVLI